MSVRNLIDKFCIYRRIQLRQAGKLKRVFSIICINRLGG
jgi:hypothetical protein